MSIFNSSFNAPARLTTPDAVLFMTDVNYYESDYEAAMASREGLRLWSQSNWPEDSFTAAENRADLQLHVDDNVAHRAYGFMIFSPDRRRCLGSVYVNPLTSLESNYAVSTEDLAILQSYDARIDYWLRDDIDPMLERRILRALREWFIADWKIRPLFAARPEMKSRIHLYGELGFVQRLNLRGLGVAVALFD